MSKKKNDNVIDLPDKDKRPKNKPPKKIKVNSFATAMAAAAQQENYRGPQKVDKNGNIKEKKLTPDETIEDLLNFQLTPEEQEESDREFESLLKDLSNISDKKKSKPKIDPKKVIDLDQKRKK